MTLIIELGAISLWFYLASLLVSVHCFNGIVEQVETCFHSSDDAEGAAVEPETEMDMIEPLNLEHMHKYLNLVGTEHD